jgi:uncharacterized protein involved in type VI secretion and phage assembly
MTCQDPDRAALQERVPLGFGGLFYGAYPALVKDVADPDGQGRVQVTLPWSPDGGGARYEAWARVATFMAGGNRGAWFIPDAGDEVLVVFAGGDPRHPFVIGAMWNGADSPPVSMDGSGRNDVKMIRSRNGVTVRIDDANGREKIVIETPGQQKLTLKDGPGEIEIEDSNGNSISMTAAGLRLYSSATVTVNAASVRVSAGSVEIDTGMAKFSGVVKCETLQANSVQGGSYTPGAGNIL